MKEYYNEKMQKQETQINKLQSQLNQAKELNIAKNYIINNQRQSVQTLKQYKQANHIITPRIKNIRNNKRHRDSLRSHIKDEQQIKLVDELRNDSNQLNSHLKESFQDEFESDTNRKIIDESRDLKKAEPAMVAHNCGYEGYGMMNRKRILRMYERDPETQKLTLRTLEGTKIIKEKTPTSKILSKSMGQYLNQDEHLFLKMEVIKHDDEHNRGVTKQSVYRDYITGILTHYATDLGNKNKVTFNINRFEKEELKDDFEKEWNIKWYRSKDAQPVDGFKEKQMTIINERHNAFEDDEFQKSHHIHPSEALLCGDTSDFCRERYTVTDPEMKEIESNAIIISISSVDDIKGKYKFNISFYKIGDWKTSVKDTKEMGPSSFCPVAKSCIYYGGDRYKKESYKFILPKRYSEALALNKYRTAIDHLDNNIVEPEPPYITFTAEFIIVLYTDVIDARVDEENDKRIQNEQEAMNKEEEYDFRKKQCHDLECPYYEAPDVYAVHKENCPLHPIIQVAAHELGDFAQEANDSWELQQKSIIYDYWCQHKYLNISVGKQLKSDIENGNVVGLHIPGNEGRLALHDILEYFLTVDPYLTEGHQKIKIGVRIIKSLWLREIFYNCMQSKFDHGYNCFAIKHVIKRCFSMGWIINEYDPNSGYPYIWFIVFVLGPELSDHVQESENNRGYLESMLHSHERVNKEFKLKCKRNNNHFIEGLVFIMHSLGIKRIGGQKYGYFLDSKYECDKKFKLLSDDLYQTYIKFDQTLLKFSDDIQLIVRELRKLQPGDPTPASLLPFLEDKEMDEQLKMIEKLKQKRIASEKRKLEKQLQNQLNELELEKMVEKGLDKTKISDAIDDFVFAQLKKSMHKKSYKQSNDGRKRRRMNVASANL